ncbi:hypothetical protein JL722_15031 [Aureococcus anophagefferens]|nr:hypothetical protein JL722_15031 [Aureococcus anophagefferens]
MEREEKPLKEWIEAAQLTLCRSRVVIGQPTKVKGEGLNKNFMVYPVVLETRLGERAEDSDAPLTRAVFLPRPSEAHPAAPAVLGALPAASAAAGRFARRTLAPLPDALRAWLCDVVSYELSQASALRDGARPSRTWTRPSSTSSRRRVELAAGLLAPAPPDAVARVQPVFGAATAILAALDLSAPDVSRFQPAPTDPPDRGRRRRPRASRSKSMDEAAAASRERVRSFLDYRGAEIRAAHCTLKSQELMLPLERRA